MDSIIHTLISQGITFQWIKNYAIHMTVIDLTDNLIYRTTTARKIISNFALHFVRGAK